MDIDSDQPRNSMHNRGGQPKSLVHGDRGEVGIKITGHNDPTKYLSASGWNKSTLTSNLRIESRRAEVVITDRSKAISHRARVFGPTQNQEPMNNFTLGRTKNPSKTSDQPGKTSSIFNQEILRTCREFNTCSAANDDRLKWNSVTTFTAIEMDKKLVALTAGSRSHSINSSKILIKNGYINPTQREETYNAFVRERKSAGTFSPSLTTYVRSIDPPMPSALNKSTKSSRYSTSEHSGVWKFNAIEKR